MTAEKSISTADELRPNSILKELKLKWLCDIESRIYNEVFITHKNGDSKFTDTENITGGTTLFLKPPYDEVYILYLCSMIDFYNGEYGRYNNDNALLKALYKDFCIYYNSTHESASAEIITR